MSLLSVTPKLPSSAAVSSFRPTTAEAVPVTTLQVRAVPPGGTVRIYQGNRVVATAKAGKDGVASVAMPGGAPFPSAATVEVIGDEAGQPGSRFSFSHKFGANRAEGAPFNDAWIDIRSSVDAKKKNEVIDLSDIYAKRNSADWLVGFGPRPPGIHYLKVVGVPKGGWFEVRDTQGNLLAKSKPGQVVAPLPTPLPSKATVRIIAPVIIEGRSQSSTTISFEHTFGARGSQGVKLENGSFKVLQASSGKPGKSGGTDTIDIRDLYKKHLGDAYLFFPAAPATPLTGPKRKIHGKNDKWWNTLNFRLVAQMLTMALTHLRHRLQLPNPGLPFQPAQNSGRGDEATVKSNLIRAEISAMFRVLAQRHTAEDQAGITRFCDILGPAIARLASSNDPASNAAAADFFTLLDQIGPEEAMRRYRNIESSDTRQRMFVDAHAAAHPDWETQLAQGNAASLETWRGTARAMARFMGESNDRVADATMQAFQTVALRFPNFMPAIAHYVARHGFHLRTVALFADQHATNSNMVELMTALLPWASVAPPDSRASTSTAPPTLRPIDIPYSVAHRYASALARFPPSTYPMVNDYIGRLRSNPSLLSNAPWNDDQFFRTVMNPTMIGLLSGVRNGDLSRLQAAALTYFQYLGWNQADQLANRTVETAQWILDHSPLGAREALRNLFDSHGPHLGLSAEQLRQDNPRRVTAVLRQMFPHVDRRIGRHDGIDQSGRDGILALPILYERLGRRIDDLIVRQNFTLQQVPDQLVQAELDLLTIARRILSGAGLPGVENMSALDLVRAMQQIWSRNNAGPLLDTIVRDINSDYENHDEPSLAWLLNTIGESITMNYERLLDEIEPSAANYVGEVGSSRSSQPDASGSSQSTVSSGRPDSTHSTATSSHSGSSASSGSVHDEVRKSKKKA